VRVTSPFLRFAVRYLPSPEWLLNHVVNRLPYAAWRMRLYAAFGVRFEDPSTGCLMLGVEVESPRRLAVGRNTIVGPGVLLDARGGLTLGANVNVTGGTRFMSAKHDVQDPDFVAHFAPIVVDDRAWIALGATVLGGVRIGEGAVVAANATVTTDVAPFTIVAGTPAVPIGTRTRELRYDLDYRPNWA
jgi:acetyltransferase-like isoleucine patch superfamily enzyme